MEGRRIIVVGAGISGLTAAIALVEAGAKVTIIEKLESIGSQSCNSSLSNAGINGCSSAIQRTNGIEDKVEDFVNDIVKSGGKKSDLSELMCMNSGRCVDWLVGKFRMNFSLSRSGGQTCARTHKTRGRATGRSVVAAMAKFASDTASSKPDRLELITEATASKLLVQGNNEVVGIEYEKHGAIHALRGRVILCSGGFGADFNTHTSLIARYRPDLIKLPTACNLGTSTGDGIKLGEQVGAKLTDMMYVTVNPSGLVDPGNPSSRFKITASESLRGDGGIILNKEGRRIVNELAKREFLSQELMKREGPFYLIINSRMSARLADYTEEYIASGLMRKMESGEDLAKEIGVAPAIIEAEFSEYNAAAIAASETQKSDKFGKVHFRKTPFEMDDTFYVARIEPVIQYCAGGLMIDTSARVLGRHGQPITGLYAAGEVAGGIHGSQPLTGNDLLDCLVFGRTAALTAARDVYGVDYVDRHINPEVIKKELRATLEEQKERIAHAKQEIERLKSELANTSQQIEAEKSELGILCSKLASKYPDLSMLKFNPKGENINERFGITDAKALASEFRGKRKKAEDDVELLKLQIAEFQSKADAYTEEIASVKKAQKQVNAEKKKVANQVEELRNSSSEIREIHQLEELISTYKKRQEKAETSKRELEADWEKKRRDYEVELAEAAAKKEELEVMFRIENVERKRLHETTAGLVHKMTKKMKFETEYMERSARLAAHKDCPIFQVPLKRQLCPEVDGA
jgi:flavocytochrome c